MTYFVDDVDFSMFHEITSDFMELKTQYISLPMKSLVISWSRSSSTF